MLEFFFAFTTTPQLPTTQDNINIKPTQVIYTQQKKTLQEKQQELQLLEPTNLPLQIPQYSPLFQNAFHKAAQSITQHSGQCAKFVNRLMSARYNKQMFGNAWDLQNHPDNQAFLQLSWQIPQDSFQRQGLLRLKDRKDRVKHIASLYEFLDQQENPTGTLGSVYRFSGYREMAAQNTKLLAQTHIAMVSGKQLFSFVNKQDTPQPLEQIITHQYGPMRDFEREYFQKKLPLHLIIQPGKKYSFTDYLVEEEIFGVQSESLLQVFLRKEIRNEIDYPQVRPNSFSLLSTPLQEEIKHQQKLIDILGPVEYIPGSQWNDLSISNKDILAQILKESFNIDNPEKAVALPIPQNR